MDATAIAILVSVCAGILVLAILGLCFYKLYGTSSGKTPLIVYRDKYKDHEPATFQKSHFTSPITVKEGCNFDFKMAHVGKKLPLEFGQLDSETVLLMEMKSSISFFNRDIYHNNLDLLKTLPLHDHVIPLYGIISGSNSHTTVVELPAFGTLKYYLFHNVYQDIFQYPGYSAENNSTFANIRLPNSSNSLRQKRSMFQYQTNFAESRRTQLPNHSIYYLIWQICLGMEYLHDHDFVHGSLCTYNVFVTNHFHLKINCFPIASDDNDAGEALPRWIAPEIFSTKTLSKSGDVWSFGVTMWELFNGGGLPYKHLTIDEVIRQTGTGEFRLVPPPGDAPISRLFEECFNLYSANRPPFCEIRLVLERLLEDSEVGTSKRFIAHKRVQYSRSELLNRVFSDAAFDDTDRENRDLQRPLYFTLPSLRASDPDPVRRGSLSRIPLTMSREQAHAIPSNNKLGTFESLGYDPTYADPNEYGNNTGVGTGQQFNGDDVLSTSSAEFEDLSTSESCSSDEGEGYANMATSSIPVTSNKIRRVSSLNDLSKFRKTLETNLNTGEEERPQSALVNEEKVNLLRRFSSEEQDELPKKRTSNYSSFRRFGSAIHASFRRMRHRNTRDDGDYETLTDHNEKRSFKNLLHRSGSKKRSSEKQNLTSTSIPKIISSTEDEVICNAPIRKISQSANCLFDNQDVFLDQVVDSYNRVTPSCRNVPQTPIDSFSSDVSLAEYSDYEVPTEILEAIEKLNLPKCKSNTELMGESTVEAAYLHANDGNCHRQRSNSDNGGYKQNSFKTPKHKSCIFDYKTSHDAKRKDSFHRKNKRRSTRGILLGSFRQKQTKSISDILGSPPPLPTTRRPSILCTSCNHVHVTATLPGMSLTPKRGNSPATYENYSSSPASRCSFAPSPSPTAGLRTSLHCRVMPSPSPGIRPKCRPLSDDIDYYDDVSNKDDTVVSIEKDQESDYEDLDNV